MTLTQVSPGTPIPQASTPCLEKLNARTWHGVLAVRTGDFVTGVRVNTAEAAERLDSLLAPVRAPELDAETAPNFSVELGEQRPGRRGLHLVYRDHEIVARRFDVSELVADVLALLDEVPRLAVTSGLVLYATGVVTPAGQVVLVPGRMHTRLVSRRRALESSGYSVLRNRTQVVDPGRAVVCGALVDTELSALAERAGLRLTDLPVSMLCARGEGTEPFALRRAQSVFAWYDAVLNRYSTDNGQVLSDLAELSRRVTTAAVPDLPSAGLAHALIGLVEGS